MNEKSANHQVLCRVARQSAGAATDQVKILVHAGGAGIGKRADDGEATDED